MRGVTREQKLALIVGFALLLLVGLLISDHFSGASKAKIARVEPDSSQPVPPPLSLSIPAPGPAAETHVAAPGRSTSDDVLQLVVAPPTTTPPQPEPAPQGLAPLTPAPDRVASGAGSSPSPDPSRQDAGSLQDQITRSGGRLSRGPDGTWNIHLPGNTIHGVSSTPHAPATREATVVAPNSPDPLGDRKLDTVKTHTVRSGETLYQIANRYYGNGNLWNQLAKFNNTDKTGTIRVGATLRIPPKETLVGNAAAAASSNPPVRTIPPPQPKPTPRLAEPDKASKPRIELASYTVRKGDTLGTISQKTLGTAKRWQEIAELNKLDDEDAIVAGTVLKIPAKRS